MEKIKFPMNRSNDLQLLDKERWPKETPPPALKCGPSMFRRARAVGLTLQTPALRAVPVFLWGRTAAKVRQTPPKAKKVTSAIDLGNGPCACLRFGSSQQMTLACRARWRNDQQQLRSSLRSTTAKGTHLFSQSKCLLHRPNETAHGLPCVSETSLHPEN